MIPGSGGAGDCTVTLRHTDCVPDGFVTVTLAVVGTATRLAGTLAVNSVVLTAVVASAVPFQYAVLVVKKLAPLSVSVSAPLSPAAQQGMEKALAQIRAMG